MPDASCDLTDFGDGWPAFKAKLGLVEGPRHPSGWFTWIGPGLVVVTGNNPDTGEYHTPGRRDPEPGFASYIGASGDNVDAFKAALLRHALYRKSPIADSRCYI